MQVTSLPAGGSSLAGHTGSSCMMTRAPGWTHDHLVRPARGGPLDSSSSAVVLGVKNDRTQYYKVPVDWQLVALFHFQSERAWGKQPRALSKSFEVSLCESAPHVSFLYFFFCSSPPQAGRDKIFNEQPKKETCCADSHQGVTSQIKLRPYLFLARQHNKPQTSRTGSQILAHWP